jgi:protein-tyrosine phosphatase
MHPDHTDRAIPLDGATNFRDLGGLQGEGQQRLRRGQVYRSDHLARLSAPDHQRLHLLGVSHCVDLRGTAERAATPDHLPGVNIEHLGIEPTVAQALKRLQASGVVPGRAEAEALMHDAYRAFVRLHGPVFGRLLQRIAALETPLVFHCTAGKDRTGVAAALLLGVLGVHRDDVMQDYLLTNHFYRRDHRLLEDVPAAVLDVLWAVQPAFLATAWHCIDEEFGGLSRYLKGPAGMSEQQLQRLQTRLLEA